MSDKHTLARLEPAKASWASLQVSPVPHPATQRPDVVWRYVEADDVSSPQDCFLAKSRFSAAPR